MAFKLNFKKQKSGVYDIPVNLNKAAEEHYRYSSSIMQILINQANTLQSSEYYLPSMRMVCRFCRICNYSGPIQSNGVVCSRFRTTRSISQASQIPSGKINRRINGKIDSPLNDKSGFSKKKKKWGEGGGDTNWNTEVCCMQTIIHQNSPLCSYFMAG